MPGKSFFYTQVHQKTTHRFCGTPKKATRLGKGQDFSSQGFKLRGSLRQLDQGNQTLRVRSQSMTEPSDDLKPIRKGFGCPGRLGSTAGPNLTAKGVPIPTAIGRPPSSRSPKGSGSWESVIHEKRLAWKLFSSGFLDPMKGPGLQPFRGKPSVLKEQAGGNPGRLKDYGESTARVGSSADQINSLQIFITVVRSVMEHLT